jgi:hypothetical protein
LQEFQSLVKLPGWVRLVSVLDKQVSGRKTQLLQSLTTRMRETGKNLEEIAIEDEYLRGEIAGMGTFRHLPEVQISEAELIVDQLEAKTDDGSRTDNG